jgi:tRNA (guanine-N7-)-methyltransferase
MTKRTEPGIESTKPARPSGAVASEAGGSVIYKADNWFKPLDWGAVFSQTQPLEIDLGCGKGSFLIWAAANDPQRNFLGVDRLLRRLRRVDRKSIRGGLTNLRLVRLEAGYLVSKLVPDASVSTYHILFPDPWPKRRHHGRRLISPDFLTHVRRTLTFDGAVNCATDHADYFEHIQRTFRTSARFEEAEAVALPVEAQTDFEKEFVAAGKQVYRCRWLKKSRD